jgi:hypothetical protein
MISSLETSITNRELFQTNLHWWNSHVESGLFRRRLVVLLSTDIAMLICFGALFPPLSVVIALSILKDVISIRLALGRYCEIINAVEVESFKEQMQKLKNYMDEEMLKAGANIWNGVWDGTVLGTWIWGFVLFDTMASTEGVEKGFCVFFGMIVSPFILFYLFQATRQMKCSPAESADVALKQMFTLDEDNYIEMRASEIASNPVHSIDGDISVE